MKAIEDFIRGVGCGKWVRARLTFARGHTIWDVGVGLNRRMASGEVVVQVHGKSPLQFNYVDPGDDPGRK